ncbi:hypothetical protein [Kitasatospora indigofera]|uniref:hypothetical protein n=1 Tax=Kitasatospora indigofera TaxID=67307 RepID=UPI0036A3DA2C
MTTAQLYKRATDLDIADRSTMRRDELQIRPGCLPRHVQCLGRGVGAHVFQASAGERLCLYVQFWRRLSSPGSGTWTTTRPPN